MYPTVLKRPPSGRKVWGTTKSVSPRTVQYNNTVPKIYITVQYSTAEEDIAIYSKLYSTVYSSATIKYCINNDQ